MSIFPTAASTQRALRLRGLCALLAVALFTVSLASAGPGASTGAVANAPNDPLQGFDPWVETIMKEWKVPGLGVAIIADNKLHTARGYGYRDLENKTPADGDTLFAIGSNSKSFTATILAMLEDKGKLVWDEPVRETLTDFKLYDPVATEQMTAVDLLSHRSGLPRHDLSWYGSPASRRELLERLRYLEPTEPFRAKFQYQNLMFMTAGILAEEITGKSWEDLVQANIFDPIGMERSNFSVEAMQQDDNFSYPHFHQEESEIERIPFRNIDAVGPAGSINSSAREMAKYVLFHLNRGKVSTEDDAERLLSEANATRMQSPQMVVQGPLTARFSGDAEIGDLSYGMGLMVSSYRGHPHIFHGGGIDGFISAMEWLPNDGIGVVVLSNTNGSGQVPTLVARNVLDRMLGLDPVDWAGRARTKIKEAKETADANGEAKEERHENTSPSHALDDYAGSFQHPGYDAITITLKDKALELSIPAFAAPLEHHHYDVFAVPKKLEGPAAGFAGTKVQFFYSKAGTIDRIAVPLEPTLEDIVFKRVASQELEDVTFLARLTGEYALGPLTATVALDGDSLTLDIAGQPQYQLVPDSGMSFAIKGLESFSIEFDIDSDAPSGTPATAIIAHQPNGTFRGERKKD